MNKTDKNYMMTIEPSYKCNMHCQFCYNSNLTKNLNESKTDIDFNKIFLNDVLDEISSTIPCKDGIFIINLLGGEVLADFWSDEYINHLYDFLVEANNRCIIMQRKLHVIFNTNLVHIKTNRWIELFMSLLKFADVKINTSYDIYGRFSTEEQLDIFKKNISLYKDYINVINVMKTKPMLRILIKHEYKSEFEKHIVDYFDELYLKFKSRLLIDDYVCNDINIKNIFQCSNSENYEINKYLLDNYKDLDLYNFKKVIKSRCNFLPGLILDPQCKHLPDCIFASVSDEFIQGIKHIDEPLKNKLIRIHTFAANKLKCYSCKYYKICPSACPMSIATLDKTDDEECFIKKTIDYINKNKIYG